MRRVSRRRAGLSVDERKRLKLVHREVVMLRHGAYEVREGKALLWYGKCARCRHLVYLQVAHIFPVGQYPASRYDPDNAVAMCALCHIYWWHKNVIAATEWIKERLGDAYEKLALRVRTARKPDYMAQMFALANEARERRMPGSGT